jgi:hypothetical protein
VVYGISGDKTTERARRYNSGHTMVAYESENGGKTMQVGDRGVDDSGVGDKVPGCGTSYDKTMESKAVQFGIYNGCVRVKKWRENNASGR